MPQRVSPVQIESSPGEFTHYVIVDGQLPVIEQLPWSAAHCDAFVIVLNGRLLSDELAAGIAEALVKLPVGWVETLGTRCAYLHDLIDSASVSIGRQATVGDGNPMTAWHEQLSDLTAMAA